MLTANYHLHFISFFFPGRDKDFSRYIVLTSNLLSRLAFLKAEVTELASFSAIHALKSFTAKEAAIPIREKDKRWFSNFQHKLELIIRSSRLQKSYKTAEWKYIYDNRNKHITLKRLFFFFNAKLVFWIMLDCLKIFFAHLHSAVQRFSLQLFFLHSQFIDWVQCKKKNYTLNQQETTGTKQMIIRNKN